MVAILEVNKKISKNKMITDGAKIEGKIEWTLALIGGIVLITFWNNVWVEIGGLLFGSLWCLAKIYFRKDRWVALLLVAIIMLQQGVFILAKHIRLMDYN